MSPSVIESRETKRSLYQSGFQLSFITLSDPWHHITVFFEVEEVPSSNLGAPISVLFFIPAVITLSIHRN